MTVLINRFISDAEIETRAYHLLHQYALRCQPILQPPVPVEQIIDLVLDIPVVWDPIPDQNGDAVLAKLVIKGERAEIIVNEDKLDYFEQHNGVEAYSLAHELGHKALHIDESSLLAQPLANDEERTIVLCRGPIDSEHKRREWQAERFAAFLLMPKDLVLQTCANVDLLRWTNLYRLRDLFGVSITALVRRLKELHLLMVTSDGRLVPYQDAVSAGLPSLWN